ncbi:MAG: hypothetical protein JXR96_25770 [Deltaproteobacteria bacterium]|nr:hypothetical protein [Deltaproteobacteria bacterium]
MRMQPIRIFFHLFIAFVFASCSLEVAGPNRPPVAQAGMDQETLTDTEVRLDGSASFDPDGDALQYTWTMLAAPASGAEGWASEGPQAWFVPKVPGSYLVSLEVSDGPRSSEPDMVRILVRSRCQTDNDCDDGEACTLDSCQLAGCTHEAVADGTRCGELGCQGIRLGYPTCLVGECTGFELVEDCDDGNACTTDDCSPSGCTRTNNTDPCDDEDPCTMEDRCAGGICLGVAEDADHDGFVDENCGGRDCDDADPDVNPSVFEGPWDGAPCDDDKDNDCDGTTDSGPGCTPCDQAEDCDDHNPCNGLETCNDGSCAPGEPLDCNDGQFCNGPESCDPQLGCVSPGDPCPRTDCNHCDEDLDLCFDPAGEPCGDGSQTACDRPDSCDGAGNCLANHEPQGTDCDDQLFCNGADVCNAAGECVHGSSPCQQECMQTCVEDGGGSGHCSPDPDTTPCSDDGVFCNGEEHCDGTGTCLGQGDPCTQECRSICVEDGGGTGHCDPDPPSVACSDDGNFCNGVEFCNGSGLCQGLGNPCTQECMSACNVNQQRCEPTPGLACSSDSSDCTLDECDASGACAHVPDDDLCTPPAVCVPACDTDGTGCVSPPASLTLVCDPDLVDLMQTDTSACRLATGSPDQGGCLACRAEVGAVLLDRADFGDDAGQCELDGWELMAGGAQLNCFGNLNNCGSGTGSETCCDDLAVICVQHQGRYALAADKRMVCGPDHEEFQLRKAFDLTDYSQIEVCVEVADHGGDNNQVVAVFAGTERNRMQDQVLCINASRGRLGDVDDTYFRYCGTLPAWAEGHPGVVLSVVVHSENNDRIMYLDSVSVRGWYHRCTSSRQVAFSDSFGGCGNPLADGWNGWQVSSGTPGTSPQCPGTTCETPAGDSLPGNTVEVDGDWMILERGVDTSMLDGDVQLCFTCGDDGAVAGTHLLAEFDTGGGWQTAFETGAGLDANKVCRQVCASLSEIDPRAARNADLRIRFDVDARPSGKLFLYDVQVDGAVFCEEPAWVATSALNDIGGGRYDLTARDLAAEPLDADVVCEWGDPAGTTVATADQVAFRDLGWWNPDYGYRRKLVVISRGPAVPTGYSVWFDAYTNALVAAGKLRADRNDWRILRWDGAGWVELDRWLDEDLGSGGPSRAATRTWFKLPFGVVADGSDSSIYVYYGNPTEASAAPAHWADSMGADTPASRVFVAADDFEEHTAGEVPDGWTVHSGCSNVVVAVDGVRKVLADGDGTGGVVSAGQAGWVDIAVRHAFRSPGSDADHAGVIARMTGVDDLVYGGIVDSTHSELWERYAGSFHQIGSTWGIADVHDQWHIQEIRVAGDGVSIAVDDVVVGSGSLAAEAPDAGASGFWCQYGPQGYRDNHIVRLYVDPEPEVLVGTEQTAP